MVCSVCGFSIGKVCGNRGGYYGCVKASKKACTNHLMVSKKVAEKIIISEVIKIISDSDCIKYILFKVEQLVSKLCSTVPEEIQRKKTELSQNQQMVNNFISFIAEGHSSKAIADSLALSEHKIEVLTNDLQILETTNMKVFKTPPIEWIEDRVAHVKEVFEKQTEQSALLLRKLLGTISLQPVTPDIGKPYLIAISKLQPLALFEDKRPRKGPLSPESNPVLDTGSNSLQWWRWWESNPRPKNLQSELLHR